MEEGAWCLDKGASWHMCRNKYLFESISDGPVCEIKISEKETAWSYGSGTIRLNCVIPEVKSTMKLKNVLYAPRLRNNLLSASAMTEQGYQLTFLKGKMSIKRDDGSTALVAKRKGRFYVIDHERRHEAMTVHDVEKSSPEDLSELQRSDMVRGWRLYINLK